MKKNWKKYTAIGTIVLLLILSIARINIALNPPPQKADIEKAIAKIKNVHSKIDLSKLSKQEQAEVRKAFNKIIDQSVQKINEENYELNKSYWAVQGTIGDFTAGVIGTFLNVTALIFVVLSFNKQKDANRMQLDAFNHDKTESRFFELIRLHKDNVDELKFTHFISTPQIEQGKLTYAITESTAEKRKFFVIPYDQFKKLQEELSGLFEISNEVKIYQPEYLKQLKQNSSLNDRGIDLVQYAKIDLMYLIVFFGVGRTGQEAIRTQTKNKYQTKFLNRLIDFAALKPKRQSRYWDKWEKTYESPKRNQISLKTIRDQKIEKEQKAKREIIPLSDIDAESDDSLYYGTDYEKYYGGHQFRLGHYFRHLYHTIKYIDKADLKPEEKRSYIKHLRGQLSNNEQTLIFLNSLSQLGRTWELENKKNGSAIPEKEQLITEYDMIKNISVDQVMPGIFLKKYYPKVDYEGF